MADPLFHLATGVLLKAALNERPLWALAFGTVLPDFASRLPSLGSERLLAWGIPLPGWVNTGWSVFHQPIGAAILSFGIASLFVPDQRRDVFVGLYAGVALHFLVDLLQFHHGQGYALLFPFSNVDFELGWIGSEATLPWTLPVTAVAFATWGWRLYQDYHRNPVPAPVTDVRHPDN